MPPLNIVELIAAESAPHRDKAAVIEGEHVLAYGALLQAVAEVAATLADLGIRPRQRIAFLCEDCTDYIIGNLAILKLGAVVVPVSPSLAGDEIDAVQERIDVHGLLFEGSSRPAGDARSVAAAGFRRRRFFWIPRLPQRELPPEYAALNPAFIRFSSGTTGASKGVLLSHETIRDRTSAADTGLHISPEDVVIWVLSMSYHFVVTILLFLRRGATIVLCNQAFPDSFLDGLARQRGTFLYASPFHYHLLATSARCPPDALARVRMAVSTAMKLPAPTGLAFAERFGFELTEAYGIIEVGLPFISVASDRAQRGSVGRPLPGYQIRIANPDAAGVGEILLTGKGLFDAYFSPWQSREQYAPGGWFKTGDLGRLDGSGCLFIRGRDKNVINFIGMKIFPNEVEEVINQHPAVQESLVYPVAHPQYGQVPYARFVLRPGTAAPAEAELRRFCFKRLAPFKVPKAFECVAELGKTASGKLRRA